MPKITFLPMNRTVEANPGETILDAGLRADIPIQHACGGYCACTTCHVIVKAGGAALSEIEECEEERLERANGLTLHSRLACQARVRDDVTIEVVNLED
ncbi:MAG: 2Fe-2S ferredoxin [Bdellovibrionales bacterium GWB1_55_8]|nr:MAG: 2Fe-2S ferredoxin [Bdellovibrionales bacterium GWB1_55_8]